MQRFSPLTAIFGGVTVYAIMFLLWSVSVSYGFTVGLIPAALHFAVLIGVLVYLTRAQQRRGLALIPYALTWVCTVFLLDVVVTVPFSGWVFILDPMVWVGYALVVCVPLVHGFGWHKAVSEER